MKINEKIQELYKRIEELEAKLGIAQPMLPAPPAEREPSKLGKLIIQAVKDKSHILLKSDLIYCRDLTMVMNVLYPNEAGFKVDPDAQATKSRGVGALLAREKLYPKLATRVHFPATTDSKRVTHNLNVWVLRKFNKYRTIGPSELYRVHKAMWNELSIEYRMKTMKDEGRIDIDTPVSFL